MVTVSHFDHMVIRWIWIRRIYSVLRGFTTET